jgi:hypothetical protein
MRSDFLDAARHGLGVDTRRLRRRNESGDAAQHNLRRIIAARRQAALAVDARVGTGAAQNHVDLRFDVIRRALLNDKHGPFAGTEFLHFFRHQRIADIEHIDRDARGAVEVGKIEPRQSAQHAIGQAAENDDADFANLAGDQLIELLFANEFLRRRQALFDFQPFLREGRRRMREPAIFEPDRSREPVPRVVKPGFVVFGDELAGEVTGAYSQVEHDRRVARLGQLKAFFHHLHDGRQIGPRVDEPDRGFHCVGVGAFLDHARTFAVVLAEYDQGAADDARRSEVRQSVGCDVGADDRFPGHRAAQRIIDRGAEHGRGRRLVGAGLDVHAKLGEQVLGFDHDVQEMRDRRALIAADIAHAGLQEGLGDGEDAFAAKAFTRAKPQRFDFFGERAFHE